MKFVAKGTDGSKFQIKKKKNGEIWAKISCRDSEDPDYLVINEIEMSGEELLDLADWIYENVP